MTSKKSDFTNSYSKHDELVDTANVPEPDDKYLLEEILAEYGGSREQKIIQDVERKAAAELAKETAASEAAPQTGSPASGAPAEADSHAADSAEKTAPVETAEAGQVSADHRSAAHLKKSGSANTTMSSVLNTIKSTVSVKPGKRVAQASKNTGPEKNTPPAKAAEAAEKAPSASRPETAASPDKNPDSASAASAEMPLSKAKKARTRASRNHNRAAASRENQNKSTPPVSAEQADLEAERARQEAQDKLLAQGVDLPPSRPLTMSEVVGNTVEEVLEEHREQQSREPLIRPRLGLFSRRAPEDTESFSSTPAKPKPKPEPPPPPEPSLKKVSSYCKALGKHHRAALSSGLIVALIPTLLLLLEHLGLPIPFWSNGVQAQSLVLLVCLLLTVFFCRAVLHRALHALSDHRFTGECLITFSALAALVDCLSTLVLKGRSAVPPYASVSALALVFAQYGLHRENRGFYDTFRIASLDSQPPYLVTDTEKGACKQRGAIPGFVNTSREPTLLSDWESSTLPVMAIAAVVFAFLSSFGRERRGDFLLNLSAILAAGGTFALPLCWSLPFSRLARHLQKSGCAVAGWSGAEAVSQYRTMIVGDTDLFPPGTIFFNGVRTYNGDEPKHVVAYAAAMTKAADCGLARLFEERRRSDFGPVETVDDFCFYEEGGYSGTIRGESVLLGTASFMQKMDVRLPKDINLKTGIFLAIDRHLSAVFAVKYSPSENVDFALRIMRRCRITPILASRDPNITPALIKRKFKTGMKMEYPELTERVALSEAEQDLGSPQALLFREGLLPYAETVAGCRRLCRAARRSEILAIISSVIGTILAFYMVFLGAYSLLTPLSLTLFLLLWTLPVLLISDWASRY